MTSSSQFSASAAQLTQRVLSIQSHTVNGYVGNKAATFPLQCLGFNVDAINTITLSNHPSYQGGTKGKSLNPEDVTTIIDGLDSNDLLKYDLIITGYTKSVELALETAKTIKRVIQSNPKTIYVLDPVLGDDGKFYLPEELVDCFVSNLLPLATIITPNQFEVQKKRMVICIYLYV
jgi:pyridoxine kinase